MVEKFKTTAKFIIDKAKIQPEIGVILGSGLGGFADKIENPIVIPYEDIPDFPVSTVEGHSGKLIIGQIDGKNIVAMKGRFHYYEGYSMEKVTFPVRIMKFLGVHTLMVSNAAGGLNPDYLVGDLMLITDHINLFPNPLIGKNIDELGPRFPDMSKPYSHELIELACKIAQQANIKLQKGVYIGSTGPTFETPAEYRLYRNMGADATGMSTVPEVIVARHMGIRCFGISVITNASEPADPNMVNDHVDVQNVAGSAEPYLTKIFSAVIKQM